jgi:hypothetical protein
MVKSSDNTLTEQIMAKSAKSKWNGFSLKPRKDVPEGLWLRCSGCEEMVIRKSRAESTFARNAIIIFESTRRRG